MVIGGMRGIPVCPLPFSSTLSAKSGMCSRARLRSILAGIAAGISIYWRDANTFIAQ